MSNGRTYERNNKKSNRRKWKKENETVPRSGCRSGEGDRTEKGVLSRPSPPSSPRRVKASRYGLTRRTRTTDAQAESSVITRLIGRRRDETAASVLSTAARDGTSARSWERAFLIYSYRRRCWPRLQPEYNGVRTRGGGDIGGERNRNIPTVYHEEPVYNFISRRPGAPRRDRRHAHLCVSWAPAQVASPFAAPQRLMLLCCCRHRGNRCCCCCCCCSQCSCLCVASSLHLFAPDKSGEQ